MNKLSQVEWLKRYAFMDEDEIQSILNRHPEVDNIYAALDIEYEWYLGGLD